MIRSRASHRGVLAPALLALVGVAAIVLTGTPAPAAEPVQVLNDPVLVWNDQVNRTIKETATDPLQASRALALESIAVLDTIRSLFSAPGFLVRLPGARDLKPAIAVSSAAHEMLVRLFPTRRATLDAALNVSLTEEPAGADRDRAVVFGKAVADAVFARREDDGWNSKDIAIADTSPDQWRPTPPDILSPLNPRWASITPFALTRPSQFRPAGPPAQGSVAFREAADFVATIGAAQSAERTAAQTEIARYWSDAIGTSGPPGHWNAIAAGLVAPLDLGMEAEAELFAELNVAMADTGIAVADAKYNYRVRRPITVIREGAVGSPPNPEWAPLLTTPNHPSYISGHSAYGGAAAAVLTARLGVREFSFASGDLPGVTRNFTSFQQAAEEAATSQLYGGINYPFDISAGLATGRAVAEWTSAAFHRISEDRGPLIIMDRVGSPTSPRAQIPAGFAIDNFSPVKTVTVRLEGGARYNVAVDDNGRFTLPRMHPRPFGHTEALLVATSATGRTSIARLLIDGAASGSFVTVPFTVQ